MPSPLSSSTLRTLAAAAVGAVAGASLVAALGLRKSRCAQSAAAVQPNGYLPSLTPEEAQALPIFSTDYALPAGVSVRRATTADGDALFALMSAVAVGRGGLAREADEVDRAYTDDMLASALNGGIMMLAEYTDPSDPAAVPRVIAELKMARLGPHRSFRSSLTDTTMAVHPDFQGKKIGQHLFSRVFEHLTGTSEFAHIRRVELIARASNRGAHLMYEKVGFRLHTIIEQRIVSPMPLAPAADEDFPLQFEGDVLMVWYNPNFHIEALKQKYRDIAQEKKLQKQQQ